MRPVSIKHLKDHAIVHVVDKLTGGGKKKAQRKSNQTQSDQSGSSLSETDMLFELVQSNCKMDDEVTQGMMDKMKHIVEGMREGILHLHSRKSRE